MVGSIMSVWPGCRGSWVACSAVHALLVSGFQRRGEKGDSTSTEEDAWVVLFEIGREGEIGTRLLAVLGARAHMHMRSRQSSYLSPRCHDGC